MRGELGPPCGRPLRVAWPSVRRRPTDGPSPLGSCLGVSCLTPSESWKAGVLSLQTFCVPRLECALELRVELNSAELWATLGPLTACRSEEGWGAALLMSIAIYFEADGREIQC